VTDAPSSDYGETLLWGARELPDGGAPLPGGSPGAGLTPGTLPEGPDELATRADAGSLPREVSAVVGTGLLASTGYVLLNTRAGLWLLSALTAKPLWKEFDPLEVLYAWENEDNETDRQGGETLVSLVE
jgi:hypothetical protein